MDIRGKGASAYDADMVLKTYDAMVNSRSGKVSRPKIREILEEAFYALRDRFEDKTSTAGLKTTADVIANTARSLLKLGMLQPSAAKAVKDFIDGTAKVSIPHAVEDLKLEIAHNRRNNPPPRRTTTTT